MIVVAILAIYWRVHGFDYVWDDVLLFVEDPSLRQDVTLQSLSQRILPGVSYFRPLVLASFALEFKLFGVDPAVSHMVNLCIHVLNTLLVGGLAYLLVRESAGKNIWRVSAAMALYGLHPILVEPVAWAAGRFDLLVTTFGLLGLILLLVPGARSWRYPLVALTFLCAALCKEMAIAFPLLAFLLLWCQESPGVAVHRYLPLFFRRHAVLVLIVFLAGIAYLWMRWRYLPVGGELLGALPLSLGVKVALIGNTILFYLRLALWPFPMMSVMHPFDPLHMSSLAYWMGIAVVVVVVTAGAVLLRRPSRAGLLAGAFLCALLPVLNIAPLSIAGNIGHARFLAFPLAFLALAVTQLDWRGWPLSAPMARIMPFLVGALLTLFLAFGMLNINITLPLWRNNLTLWSWMYRQVPNDPLASFNYLSALKQYDDMQTLGELFGQIQRRRPLLPQERLVYGDYLQSQGRYKESNAELLKYLDSVWAPHRQVLQRFGTLDGYTVDKSMATANNLRYAFGLYVENYYAQGRFDAALAAAQTMRFYDGEKYGPTWIAYGRVYYALGRFADGDKAFEHAKKFYLPQAVGQLPGWRQKMLLEACRKSPLAKGRPRCVEVLAQ
ncbi:hypothetical protein CKY51_20035 [Xanthomonas maliensis]|nr:hypothetical protein CKY51_20035 [Xanthomonas maliensis]